MNIFARAWGWLKNMFPKADIEQALQVKIATSPEMLQAQELWRNMFYGKAPWNTNKVKSKRTASAIAAEFARVCTVEFESEITGSPRADWLNEQYQPFIEHTAFQIMAGQLAAGGELILKPAINMNNGITTAIVENNCYYPVRYNNDDELMEFVTKRSLTKGEKYYTLLEHNNYDETKRRFEVSYYAFKSDNPNTLGNPVLLSSVEEWANLNANYPYQNVRPWFVHIKTPIQNDVEQSDRNGVSVYSKAVDLIQELDELGELTTHEFKAGRLKQNISSDMLKKDKHGNYIIDKDMFMVLEGTGKPDSSFIDTYNPDPRQDAYKDRKNELLKEIEDNCQFSRGILSDVNFQAKTATEVEKSQQRFFIANRGMQLAWQDAFEELAAIWDEMATVYNLAPQGNYDMSFFWDDSIISSEEEKEAAYNAELQRQMQALSAGLIKPEVVTAFMYENSNYLSKITVEQIKKAMEAIGNGEIDSEEEAVSVMEG